MSKQAIQAAKQRKRWLLLPAFLVMAVVVLGGNWFASDTAKADVTAADYDMLGPYPTAADALAGTNLEAGPLVGGTTHFWLMNGGALTQPTAGVLDVTITVPSPLTITSVSPTTGPTPSCGSTGGATITCSYPANMAIGTNFDIVVGTLLPQDMNGTIAQDSVTVSANDAGAQTAVTGTLAAPTGAITVTPGVVNSGEFTYTKVANQNVAGLIVGNTASFTITVTNNSGQAVDLSLTDSVSTALDVTNWSENGAGTCAPTSTPASQNAFTCSEISLANGATVTFTISLTVLTWDPASCALGTFGSIGNTAYLSIDGADTDNTYEISNWAASDSLEMACLGTQGATPDFYHLDPFGDPDYSQDVNNNLIGWVHEMCAEDLTVDGIWPNAGAATAFDPTSQQQAPATLMFKVINANQVGNPNMQAIQASPFVDCDGEETGLLNDSLLTWYSTEPGDQFITIVNDGGSTYFDYNGLVEPGQGSIDPLIKEWNVLEPTLILAGRAEGTTDLDGATLTNNVFWRQISGQFESMAPTTVYEHVHGTHRERNGTIFHGDVIGAVVNFSVSGTCGHVHVGGVDQALDMGQNPLTGHESLDPGDNVSLITVGVPILISIEADGCRQGNGDYTLVTITTDYFGPIGSTQPDGDTETIRVNYKLAPPTNKQPLVAWAGQRVVLEHNWVDPDGLCVWNLLSVFTGGQFEEFSGFFTRYVKQNGPGSFIGSMPLNFGGMGTVTVDSTVPASVLSTFLFGGVVNATADEATTFSFDEGFFRNGNLNVPAELGDAFTQEGISNIYPNADCVSRALYESQDEGEVDISSFIVVPQVSFIDLIFGGGFDFHNATPVSQQVPFLIYYMKLESLSLGRVAGVFDGHNNGDAKYGRFSNTNPWDTASDTTSGSSNVSADVLLRARVKGWFTTTTPTGRAAVPGTATTTGLPAGRWVMPDDWELLAGVLAETYRPNYDIMFAPDSGFSCSTTDSAGDLDTNRDVDAENCTSAGGQGAAAAGTTTLTHAHVQGPFSLLDNPGTFLGPDLFFTPYVGSLAPYNPVMGWVKDPPLLFLFRNTILPDGDVDLWDAPMPPALVYFNLAGSGFIKGAPKANVYSTGTNPFYTSNIPAEPWITMLNSDGEGYRINSWAAGAPYAFWDEVAVGSAVYSAAGSDSAKTTASAAKVLTSGWTNIAVYSDNHGEAMAIVNGDAGLTMSACDTTSNAAQGIVSIVGYYCENGDLVGSSTVSAVADYPDKRKSAPVASNSVSIDWTWGGIKVVDVLAGEDEQFSYVVFTVTDRDGFCAAGKSLHPVNGEVVDFIIDAGDGIIVARSDGRPTLGALEASVPVFDTGAVTTELGTRGGCQAWIKVSNSLLGVLNVLIVAYDPEGTVTFDRIVDFSSTASYSLKFRWSLVTWTGANNIPVNDALSGTGANAGGTNVKSRVTAVYGWNQAAQEWMAWFPNTGVPGAVDLQTLVNGAAYWVAITSGADVTWTWKTNVN